MKKTITGILVYTAMVLIYSCDSQGYNMYTQLNPDGSCYREFVRHTDSAFIAGDTSKNPFPVKLDSTWKLTFYKEMVNDTIRQIIDPAKHDYKNSDSTFSYYATVRKEFPSVRSLAESFRFSDSDWDSVVPVITYDKKFRWFYTYHEFGEAFPFQNPFTMVPIGNYVSKEEIETLYGENTDLYKGKIGIEIRDMIDALERRTNAWLNRNCYEETFKLYLKYYHQFRNLPVDSAAFAMAKDSIYKLYHNEDTLSDIISDFEKGFDNYFHTKAFSANTTKEIEEKFENEFPNYAKSFGMELDYGLSLPGKIIETNAPFLSGDTLRWKVDGYRFFFNDYKLYGVSRKPNYWAFGVTGIIVLLSILGFWVKKK